MIQQEKMEQGYYSKENIMARRAAERKKMEEEHNHFLQITSLKGIFFFGLLFFFIYIFNHDSLWAVILVSFLAYARIEMLMIGMRLETEFNQIRDKQAYERLERIEAMLEQQLERDEQAESSSKS